MRNHLLFFSRFSGTLPEDWFAVHPAESPGFLELRAAYPHASFYGRSRNQLQKPFWNLILRVPSLCSEDCRINLVNELLLYLKSDVANSGDLSETLFRELGSLYHHNAKTRCGYPGTRCRNPENEVSALSFQEHFPGFVETRCGLRKHQ